jgi:GntR family transcriptional regulator, rspAB operon transcriptional repressor
MLRQGIAEMRLRPGDALSEKDIAGRFGVSRQPVREAFIKLAEVGLVEVRPQRGTFVVLISIRDVQNARFVREAIESDLARHAARLATPEQLAGLRQLIEEQKRAAAIEDSKRFNDATRLSIAPSPTSCRATMRGRSSRQRASRPTGCDCSRSPSPLPCPCS